MWVLLTPLRKETTMQMSSTPEKGHFSLAPLVKLLPLLVSSVLLLGKPL
jgi:hypothetical protein